MKIINVMTDIVSHGGDKMEERVICAPGQVLKAADFQHATTPYADVLVYSYVTEQKNGIEHIYVVDHASGKVVPKPCTQMLAAFAGSEVCGGFWGAGTLSIPVCGLYGTLYNRNWYMGGHGLLEGRVDPLSSQAALKAAGKAVPMARYVAGNGVVQNTALAVSMIGPKLYCKYSDKAAAYFGLGKAAAVKMAAPQDGLAGCEFLPLPIPCPISSWEDVIGPSLGIDADTPGTVVKGYADTFYRAVFEFMRDTDTEHLYIGHKFNPVVTGLDTSRPYTVAEYRTLNNADMLAACANKAGASLRTIVCDELHAGNPFGSVDTSAIAAVRSIMTTGSLRRNALSGAL